MRQLLVGPRLRLGKKCDTWAKARRRPIALAMQIHTMLILISEILCVGKIRSRPAPGAYQQQHQQYNKDFGTRTAPEVRFPTPRSFSLRNPQRRSFGKNKSHHLSICGKEKLENMGGGAPNEIFLEMSKSGRSESVFFRRTAASICMSPWMLTAEPS